MTLQLSMRPASPLITLAAAMDKCHSIRLDW
jgi:hypothetical protein